MRPSSLPFKAQREPPTQRKFCLAFSISGHSVLLPRKSAFPAFELHIPSDVFSKATQGPLQALPPRHS